MRQGALKTYFMKSRCLSSIFWRTISHSFASPLISSYCLYLTIMERFCPSLPTPVIASVLLDITYMVSQKGKAATPDEMQSNIGVMLSEGLWGKVRRRAGKSQARRGTEKCAVADCLRLLRQVHQKQIRTDGLNSRNLVQT